MNFDMEKMELAVHELKHARDKLNIQHAGTLTSVEKEMNELCGDIEVQVALHSARRSTTCHPPVAAASKKSLVPPLPIHMISGNNMLNMDRKSSKRMNGQ